MKYDYNTAYDYENFNKRSSAAPAREPHRKAVIKELPQRKIRRRQKKQSAGVLMRVAVICAVLSMVCFNIYTRVEISDAKAAIAQADKKLQTLKSEQTKLNVEFENLISYSNLEQSAVALGMQKKTKSQICYIDTSKQDWSRVLKANE